MSTSDTQRRSTPSLNIVILGLSITSSWGNGHATAYRALLRQMAERGHRILFLERDVPWYAKHRDLPNAPYARIALYGSMAELKKQFREEVQQADVVMVGSYVPEGVAVGEWVISAARGVTVFYDIDTPVTLAKIERGETDYLNKELISRYQLYLSFTGGPILTRIETDYRSPMARVLYCSVDPEEYYPQESEKRWDLGFLGTYSADRQPALQRLLMEPAAEWPSGRFVVAGPQYPAGMHWPANVERIDHLAPFGHRTFYNQQMFTLNLTRTEMIAAGYSPGVRLFEAAACGVPIITDPWEGIDDFFDTGNELLVARSAEQILHFIRAIPSGDAREIGEAARQRVLSHHTAAHRAAELEGYLAELLRPDSDDGHGGEPSPAGTGAAYVG